MTPVNTMIAERTGVTFSWAVASDKGKVRQVNEDSFLALPGVFVVADGMGGHAAGDIASGLVADRFEQLASEVPIPVASVSPMVARLNGEIREHAHAASRNGMGTTLVAALWVDDHDDEGMVIVNVGDSRCYLLDDTGFRRLTHDHSLVQDLVDAGSITPEEAERHPDRHVVTRAMGVDESVAPDFVPLVRAGRQRLLLCSDGVSGELTEERMASILDASPEPAAAVGAMVDAVLSGQAPDNATVLVVDVVWEGLDADEVGIEVTGASRARLDDVEVTGRRGDRTTTVAGDDEGVPATGTSITDVPG